MFFNPDQNYIPTQVQIRVPPAYGNSDPDDTGLTLQLVDGGRNLWAAPDDGSDLAAIALAHQTKYPRIHAASIADFGTSEDIYQGAGVYVFGYPALMSESIRNNPILRGGIIAWTDPASPGTNTFLVDANLYPGNSGGPVFHSDTGATRNGGYMIGGRITLIGIVSKGAIEEAPVLAGGAPVRAQNPVTGIASEAEARVLGIGGIGEIEPITKIRPLIEKCLSTAPHTAPPPPPAAPTVAPTPG